MLGLDLEKADVGAVLSQGLSVGGHSIMRPDSDEVEAKG